MYGAHRNTHLGHWEMSMEFALSGYNTENYF